MNAQQKKFPHQVKLVDSLGIEFNSKNFNNNGKPIIVDFWASYCKPCIIKYNTLKGIYKEWREKTGVKIIIISIDNEERIKGAKSLIKKYDWPFEAYFDMNSELLEKIDGKGAVPRSFIYDGDYNLIFKKQGAKIMSKEDIKDASKVIKELYGEKKPLNNFICDIEEYVIQINQIISKSEN
jgi:thiol-disulfide isomerase/thioredoxin